MDTPSQKTRDVFADLAGIDLILVVVRDGRCSVNAHGSFVLFDKDWGGDHGKETMVAFIPPGQTHVPVTGGGEPIVHVHLKTAWANVRLLKIEEFKSDLIKHVDRCIRFYLEDGKTLVFGFYAKSKDLAAFTKKWGEEIKDLNP